MGMTAECCGKQGVLGRADREANLVGPVRARTAQTGGNTHMSERTGREQTGRAVPGRAGWVQGERVRGKGPSRAEPSRAEPGPRRAEPSQGRGGPRVQGERWYRPSGEERAGLLQERAEESKRGRSRGPGPSHPSQYCLLYTSDAADE